MQTLSIRRSVTRHVANPGCRVAATASVFFRRFYLRNDFCTVDPRALAPAALYLAAKVEETLLQARYLFHVMQKVAGGLLRWLCPVARAQTLFKAERCSCHRRLRNLYSKVALLAGCARHTR